MFALLTHRHLVDVVSYPQFKDTSSHALPLGEDTITSTAALVPPLSYPLASASPNDDPTENAHVSPLLDEEKVDYNMRDEDDNVDYNLSTCMESWRCNFFWR